MAIPSEWVGLPVSPTLPYLRVSKVCLMPPDYLHKYSAPLSTIFLQLHTLLASATILLKHYIYSTFTFSQQVLHPKSAPYATVCTTIPSFTHLVLSPSSLHPPDNRNNNNVICHSMSRMMCISVSL